MTTYIQHLTNFNEKSTHWKHRMEYLPAICHYDSMPVPLSNERHVGGGGGADLVPGVLRYQIW